jgi:PAS domain S-box-containing protein
MRKFLPGLSTAWRLALTFSSLFVLLVLSRNHKFWKQRKASSALVEIVSRTNERQSVFTNLYRANINEEDALLKLSYSGHQDKKLSDLTRILSQIKNNDSLFAESEKFIEGSNEQQLFDKLKLIASDKRKYLPEFFEKIQDEKYNQTITTYENHLSPVFTEFQQVNTQLLDSINNKDKKLINAIRNQIIQLSNINIWISIGLVSLLIFLGFNLIKIVKIGRRTTFALKESEKKYRTLTEQTNEIIEKSDAEGKFVFTNDSFKKRFEYNDEELSNLTISDLLDDDLLEFEEECRVQNLIKNVERVFKSKSGKKIHLEGTILLEYKNGKFDGSMGFFNDVTEKKELEESLVASELKFRNFFNLAPIPMWVIDPETNKFISVNKAASHHYGYSEAEFFNMTVFDIRKKEDIAKESKVVERIKKETLSLTCDKTGRFNSYHLKKDGEKIEVEIYTSPILINIKQCIFTIVIDVTERNNFENKITKAIIKTQEDERYEIGSELHDNICQILAAAKMSLGMIRPSLGPSVMQSYNQSRDAILLATNEIRNLSHRLAPAFFDNTKLAEAFESLLKTFNIEKNYNISMYFDKHSENIVIEQEIQLNLYRILQEQLRNIMKHSNCTEIQVSVFVYHNLLHMRISDNGIGFEVNDVKTGIGLANMKRRAELFSGKLHINTSPGQGCEVMVAIPLVTTN